MNKRKRSPSTSSEEGKNIGNFYIRNLSRLNENAQLLRNSDTSFSNRRLESKDSEKGRANERSSTSYNRKDSVTNFQSNSWQREKVGFVTEKNFTNNPKSHKLNKYLEEKRGDDDSTDSDPDVIDTYKLPIDRNFRQYRYFIRILNNKTALLDKLHNGAGLEEKEVKRICKEIYLGRRYQNNSKEILFKLLKTPTTREKILDDCKLIQEDYNAKIKPINIDSIKIRKYVRGRFHSVKQMNRLGERRDGLVGNLIKEMNKRRILFYNRGRVPGLVQEYCSKARVEMIIRHKLNKSGIKSFENIPDQQVARDYACEAVKRLTKSQNIPDEKFNHAFNEVLIQMKYHQKKRSEKSSEETTASGPATSEIPSTSSLQTGVSQSPSELLTLSNHFLSPLMREFNKSQSSSEQSSQSSDMAKRNDEQPNPDLAPTAPEEVNTSISSTSEVSQITKPLNSGTEVGNTPLEEVESAATIQLESSVPLSETPQSQQEIQPSTSKTSGNNESLCKTVEDEVSSSSTVSAQTGQKNGGSPLTAKVNDTAIAKNTTVDSTSKSTIGETLQEKTKSGLNELSYTRDENISLSNANSPSLPVPSDHGGAQAALSIKQEEESDDDCQIIGESIISIEEHKFDPLTTIKNEPGDDYPSIETRSVNSNSSAAAVADTKDSFCNIHSSPFGHMYRKDASKDITFIVENKTIKAHKSVIKARCEAFYSSIASENEIELRGVSSEVFSAFIKYLYLNKIDEIEKLAIGLLELGDLILDFDLPKDLQYKCESFLIKIINKNNAIHYLKKAHSLKAEFVKDKALNIIIYNSDELQHTEEYKELFRNPDLLELKYAILCKQEQI